MPLSIPFHFSLKKSHLRLLLRPKEPWWGNRPVSLRASAQTPLLLSHPSFDLMWPCVPSCSQIWVWILKGMNELLCYKERVSLHVQPTGIWVQSPTHLIVAIIANTYVVRCQVLNAFNSLNNLASKSYDNPFLQEKEIEAWGKEANELPGVSASKW